MSVRTERRSRIVASPALLAWILLIAALFRVVPAWAGDAVEIDNDGDLVLRPDVRAVFEKDSSLTPEDAARLADVSGIPHPSSPPSYGRFGNPVWGYLKVVSRLPRREWVLSYALATTEDIRIFIRPELEPKFHQLHELGEQAIWPFTGYRSASYVLTLEPNATYEIVVRLHTRTPVGFHLLLSSMRSFMEADRKQVVVAAFLSAVPLVVLIYIAILAAVLRQSGLTALMVMLVAKLLMDAWVSGFGLLLLPFVPRSSWSTLGFVLVMIFSLASVMHIRHFVDLPRLAPRIDRTLRGFALAFIFLCAVELTHLANVRPISQSLAPIALVAFVIAAVCHALRERTFGAACYALAWILLLIQTIMQLARLVALLPFPMENLEFAQSAVASVLFGIAIFRRVKDRDTALNDSLSETNERFRLAIEGSAAAIYEYSFSDRRFSFAPRLTELIPVSDTASFKEALKCLSSKNRRELLNGVRETIESAARYFRIEISGSHEHQGRAFAVTGAIQYARDGVAQRILGSVVDITSEHSLALERSLVSALAREKERAERALAIRTTFYAAANHDLRHPLLSLGLYLQMLARDQTLNKLGSLLPRMLEAHRSAFGYVDRLLDVARADIGSVTPSPVLQPLQPIFSKLVDQYQADAAQAGLSLRCVATSANVLTDAFLLDRILGNLLSNAISYTERGGVLIGCRKLRDGIRIDVVDTGPGLPRETYQRALSGRVNGSMSTASGAVHLGLVIVHRTAEELGCEISLMSKAERGTRFSIILR